MRHPRSWSLFILLALAVGPAAAAPLETVVGLEVARGTEERVTRAAFAGVGLGLGARAAASVALAGTDDSAVGRSSALVAGIVVAPSETARLRLRAVRSLDAGRTPAFVRVFAGPEFGAADATRLGLLYVHESNAAGDRSDGARAELAGPVAAGWTARLNTAWGTVPGGPDALSATVGTSFAPARHLELVGELGVARGTALSQQGPLDRLPGDPVPGAAATTTKATPIALVGFRVTLP